MARRLRQVTDLYTVGRVAVLADDSPVWVQTLNPFEQDTARNEAQIAKARLTIALKEHGHGEQAKVQAFFLNDGREAAVKKLVDAKLAAKMGSILDGIRTDKEWVERMQVLDRGEDDTAKPLEDIEKEAIFKLNIEFAEEVSRRMDSERAFFEQDVDALDDDALWDAFLDWYIDRRAGEVMLAEFRMHQTFFSARECDATREQDGLWDHARCDHSVRLFDTLEQVRNAPEGLLQTLLDEYDDMELTVREAKNSGRQGSFSDSSPLLSAPEESTASTPSGTPAGPPGTSSSPYPTP